MNLVAINDTTATDAPRIIRLPQVKKKVGLSKSSIYMRISAGTFPAPISLGGRAVGWIESEVAGWIKSQVAFSRSSTPHQVAA